MERPISKIKGRGSAENPRNRFEKIEYISIELGKEGMSIPKTAFYKDNSRTIITYNDSPDVGFDASINPYRGCEHGCIYCYARPTHEYLGLSAGLDFETKIFVKEDAPELLRRELTSLKWQPRPVAISGVTDPYQPAESHFCITRACLKVFEEFRNPVGIVTKNHLVTRDIDILKGLTKHEAAVVAVSITTLNPKLARVMEPRASQPSLRLKAIQKLAENGIPVIVMVAPVIPGLTDHEIPGIIEKAVEAGAIKAGYVMLRLPYGVGELFQSWLDRHFPDRKNKILSRIKMLRGGKLNSTEFHKRMHGEGLFAEQVEKLFEISCRRAGIAGNKINLSSKAFRRPDSQQLAFF
ncbi:MAG: PA0069 family radical SAM protein [Candidatus Dadabacteria bacterium]|nr:PA0069 family radical SAM protein [Candidatus Dadabacteria bacterium]